ncbi:hypothetical protein BSKO_05852 [Bryopsis sp. KO-2023]|nr:hypothetical protein BSKO_05852 [Bryopsis sp. KO-2023]
MESSSVAETAPPGEDMEGVASVEGLLHCQVSSWFPDFHHLCFSTRLVSLPQEFASFLVSDNVFSGRRHSDSDTESSEDCDANEKREENRGPSSTSSCSESSPDICDPFQEFPTVMRDIQNAIEHLGGKVLPKLNWSAPTDAVWLLPNRQLQCSTAEEIVMVLKSSDRVAHDICHAFDHCPEPPAPPVNYVLALRKWYSLRPESEFRCFVHGNELVGVSQRDVSQFYPQLAGREEELSQRLSDFFESDLRGRFPLSDYVFDVYVTSRSRIRLLDFNPIGGATSPLLFSWEDLGYSISNEGLLQNNGPAVHRSEIGSENGNEGPQCDFPIKFVEEGGGLMLGSKMAVAMPYDMLGASVTHMVEAMQNLSNS